MRSEQLERWEEETGSTREAGVALWVSEVDYEGTHQVPLSTGFSRQEYWSGFLCPLPGDLPNPGIELISLVAPAVQVDSLLLSHQGSLNLSLTKFKSDLDLDTETLY